MGLLLFNTERKEEEEIDSKLSHISISLSDNKILIKEERGLEEKSKVFSNKQEVLEYLKGIL